MPFEPYRSPYGAQIASLLQAPAQAQADALLRVGDLRARQALSQGDRAAAISQGVGATIGQVLQTPALLRQQQLALQDAQTKRAFEAEQLRHQRDTNDQAEQGQRAQQDLGTLMAAAQQPDGTFDERILADGFKAKPNIAHFGPEVLDAARKAKEGHQNFLDKQDQSEASAVQAAAKVAFEAGGTVDDFHVALLPYIKTGRLQPERVQPLLEQLQQDPDPAKVKTALRAYAGLSQVVKEVPAGGSLVDITPGQPPTTLMTTPEKVGPKDQAPSADQRAQYLQQLDAIVPPDDKPNAGLRKLTLSRVQTARSVGEAEQAIDEASKQVGQINVAKNTAGTKIQVALATQEGKAKLGQLSDAAVEQQAIAYLTSGQMPALGMGNPQLRAQILNKAAEMDPHKAIALQQATYTADKGSLVKLTATKDKVTAFENTAGKNLDQFLALAAKVPDTGVPWVNAPIRSLNKQGVGSEYQAAMEAARTVALREIARVTNDPNLNGVLSDSARQEVSQLSPTNATFAQIKAVAAVLKQDMANVHQSLDQQIQTIGGRIAPSAPTATTAAPAAPAGWTYVPKAGGGWTAVEAK